MTPTSPSKAKKPFGVFFPFVTVEAPKLEQLADCFRRITVYQPVGMKPQKVLQPWIERGFLDIRTPFHGITDEKGLIGQLKNWKAWIRSKDNEDLAYLRVMRDRIGPVRPTTQDVISQIKDTGKSENRGDKANPELQEEDASHELFLLLSQELDDQFLEVEDQLASVRYKNDSLQALFRDDAVKGNDIPIIDPLLSETRQDRGALLTEKRMIAWNHLFQKDPVMPAVFLTDAPAVFAWLFEDGKDVAKLPLPTQVACHPSVNELLPSLLKQPWEAMKERLQKARDEVGNGDGLGTDHALFDLRLLSDVSPTTFFNHRCGTQMSVAPAESGGNTVIGLWPSR